MDGLHQSTMAGIKAYLLFFATKKRQEEMLQSAKKRYLVLGGGLDRAGPRYLESSVVPGLKKSKNPRTQKLENPSLPTTYIGKAPLIPTLDQTSQEGKKSTTIKEKLRSYCPNIYTVTYIIFKLNSNTFLLNSKRVYSLLPELARNASIEYGASLGWSLLLRVYLSEYSFIF